jgi:AcrR family transcriptional regulator
MNRREATTTPKRVDGGAPPRTGRPPDPTVDARAIDAALALYRDFGLARLSFEQVARRASVGKAALYKRWSSVEELLIDGLATVAPPPDVADHGSLRRDLRQLGLLLCDLISGPHGRVVTRILSDGPGSPQIKPYFDAFVEAYVAAATPIVTRGVDRGELKADHDPSVLLAQMFGGVMIHVLFFTDPHQPLPRSSASLFTDQLVDTAIAGLRR